MTLVELVLVYTLLGVLLALMAGLCGYVQREAREQLAEDMVLTLREGLLAYRAAVGHFPPGRPQCSAAEAMAAMAQVEASAAILDNRPAPRNGPLPGRTPWDADPWGRPFRYLTPQNADPYQQERIAGDGGIPIFESAGADGDFGENDAHTRQDNLASDTSTIISTQD